MKPIVAAAVEAGLIPIESLNELAHWGVHINTEPQEDIVSVEDVVDHLRDAYEGAEQVSLDETDLDILHRYQSTEHQKSGRLILRDGKKHRTLQINFCLTCMGEYAIPWTDSDPLGILVNGETHFRWDEGDTTHDVYFQDFRELFFGSHKAFVVCTPNGEKDE